MDEAGRVGGAAESAAGRLVGLATEAVSHVVDEEGVAGLRECECGGENQRKCVVCITRNFCGPIRSISTACAHVGESLKRRKRREKEEGERERRYIYPEDPSFGGREAGKGLV